MNPNNPIRIIKRADRAGKSEMGEARAASASPRQRGRDVAGHVSAWVREFKQRRREDPRRAFASLFIDSTVPLNSVS
jgi:hypothetical protein